MTLKNLISYFLVVFSMVSGHAQILVPTHQFIGSAGGQATYGNNDNISWSIGEVVVFNDANANPTIAQAMQSYPPFIPAKNCPNVTLTSVEKDLCGTNGFTPVLTYTSTFTPTPATSPDLDSVQWYFSDLDKSSFTKIAGQTSLITNIFKPYFPGKYQVCLKYKGNTCKECSPAVSVSDFASNAIIPPIITASGSPTNQLSAIAQPLPGQAAPSLQWYVNFNNKYLMIAGGDNFSQQIRYNGDYMVMAIYQGGCRVSSFYNVANNTTSIKRASDVTYDANTIYIPEETAFSSSSLMVYPNPATGEFFVKFQSSTEITTKAELYSNTGILVKEIEFTEGGTWARTAKVDVDDLSAGVYFIKVNQEAKSLVQKVVIYK